jgi:magnesium-transporting ATPase (P-type)
LSEIGDNETDPEAIVVHGTDMANFRQEDWDRVLEHKEIVFARTMPQ